MAGSDLIETSPLTGWIAGQRGTARHVGPDAGGVRFAFYGRMSTRELQDPVSSRGWQWEAAEELIAGHGRIVAEFIDVGCTRRRPWVRRPQAAALLEAVAAPDRGFDAIVVGEYERAFAGRQLHRLLPVLDAHGVRLWLPELDGPADLDDPAHGAALLLLGTRSLREIQRCRFRVIAAMRVQTVEQGRYLGGRPPYGYRLVDAGPHPNPAHARWGRRLNRLDPDPKTAVDVVWMFAQRLAGRSIARNLNEAGVACPSGADPGRNPHRSSRYWTVHTVASILANPRYTGRQVWNRQRTEHPADVSADDGLAGRRWNPGQDWVVSHAITHPGLVGEQDFVAAQAITDRARPADGSTRFYALTGLVRCQLCERRMQPHWVHRRPGYRCRHGHTSARPLPVDHPKNLYLREDHILALIAPTLEKALGATDAGTPTSPLALAAELRATNSTIWCRPGFAVVAIETNRRPATDADHVDRPNGRSVST